MDLQQVPRSGEVFKLGLEGKRLATKNTGVPLLALWRFACFAQVFSQYQQAFKTSCRITGSLLRNSNTSGLCSQQCQADSPSFKLLILRDSLSFLAPQTALHVGAGLHGHLVLEGHDFKGCRI